MLCRDIIGIFDLDKTTVKKDTREFLNKNETKGLVETVGYDIPLSFIVTGKKKSPQEKEQEKKKGVILSPISPATLGLRAGAKGGGKGREGRYYRQETDRKNGLK